MVSTVCDSLRCEGLATPPAVNGRALCTRCKLSIVVNAPVRLVPPKREPHEAEQITGADLETIWALLATGRRVGVHQSAAVVAVTHKVARMLARMTAGAKP